MKKNSIWSECIYLINLLKKFKKLPSKTLFVYFSSKPLISLFDYWASVVITLSLVLISLIFVFEASIKVSSFRSLIGLKKKEMEPEYDEYE